MPDCAVCPAAQPLRRRRSCSTAVLVLWRRELAVIVRLFALQGVALAALVGVLAAAQPLCSSWLRWQPRCSCCGPGSCPGCCVGRSPVAVPARRETRPLVNVAASLLAAAALTLLA